jgi:hypothetical protein
MSTPKKMIFACVFIVSITSCKSKYQSYHYYPEIELTDEQREDLEQSKIVNLRGINYHNRLVGIDNVWIFSLHKDKTYKYWNWSGWGREEGYTLDSGTYEIRYNKLELNSLVNDRPRPYFYEEKHVFVVSSERRFLHPWIYYWKHKRILKIKTKNRSKFDLIFVPMMN